MQKITHDDLIGVGRSWLSTKSTVVVTEIGAGEKPDVLGFYATIKACGVRQYAVTVLIECKSHRSDFLSDRKKSFRKNPAKGMGEYRYYLTPTGLISLNELPPGWGLLETPGKLVKVKRLSGIFTRNTDAELSVLCSALRRLRFESDKHVSVRSYIIQTKNTATVTVNRDMEDIPA